jgi:hypothetical protein
VSRAWLRLYAERHAEAFMPASVDPAGERLTMLSDLRVARGQPDFGAAAQGANVGR